MSVGFIQLGQCGNQLGQSFYQFLSTECNQATPATRALVGETFFYQDNEKLPPCAKALLIDMEPKVVNRCLAKKNDGFRYAPELSFTQQEGSGNNWAYGFNVHGPKTADSILQIMDNLLEKCDYMEGIFLISSLAGGTGSGVGSYVLQLLRDRYPELNFMNICVVPHLTGEVILQSLNSTLTLSHLNQYSEGIILLTNDEASQSCNQLLGNKKPSLDQINELMSGSLASFFFPAVNQSTIFSASHNGIQYFSDIITNLLLDSRYKLLQLRHIPQMPAQSKAFTNDSWASLEKRICQMTLTGTCEYNINWSQKAVHKNIGSILVARGNEVNKHDFQLAESLTGKLVKDTHWFNNNEKSISSLHNSPTVATYLDILAERATQMIKENAYIYQYEKFGVDKDQFVESLAIFEAIIQNYFQC